MGLPTPPIGVSLTTSPTLGGVYSCLPRASEDALDVAASKGILPILVVAIAETLGINRHLVGDEN